MTTIFVDKKTAGWSTGNGRKSNETGSVDAYDLILKNGRLLSFDEPTRFSAFGCAKADNPNVFRSAR